MDDDLRRWIEQQESLPEHLQRWAVFDRPRYIWLARWLGYIGLYRLGGWVCGLRRETNEEHTERLRRYWEDERKRQAMGG